MYEQVTAEEIILAIVENMHQCLEPLLYTTWAPSLYHVYLRRADHERLRGLFPAIVAEAKQALDQELESLNSKAKGSGGLLRRFKKEPAQQRRYLKPTEGWNISFSVVEDDLEETERYRVETMLGPPPQPDFDPARQTIRVRTVGNSGSGERFKTLRVSGESATATDAPAPPPSAERPAASTPTPMPTPPASTPTPTPSGPTTPTPPGPSPAPHPTPTPPPANVAPPPPQQEPPPRRQQQPDMILRSGVPSLRTEYSRPAEPSPSRSPVPRDEPVRKSEPARPLDPSEVPTLPPSPPERDTPSIAPTQRTFERVYAIFTFADNEGRRTYRMTKPQIAIGRGRVDYWVDIKLKTKSDVSHEHAVVRYDERARRFFIKDLSTFGTTVNGVRISSSIERVGADKRDLELWTPLPPRALIGLADVIDLDFAAASEDE